MKCDEVTPLLDLLCDGGLEPKDCALVLDHTKVCVPCYNEWTAQESLHLRLKVARAATEMPPDLIKKISLKLKQEEKASARNIFLKVFEPMPLLIIAAAASIIVLLPTLFPIDHANLQATSFDAETLVTDLSTGAHLVQLPNKSAAGSKLGYEMKFLNLPDWRMQRANLYQDSQLRKLARFDFVSTDPLSKQYLCCYQGRQGEIKIAGGSQQLIAGKVVRLGQHQNLRYALWSNNGRDYLLVTTLSREALAKIVAGA